jgi:6-phosphogluconate dehydrogenase
MRIAIFGLGRMGGNMARRLCRAGIEVVGWNRTLQVARTIAAEEGLIPAATPGEAISKLPSPRVVWLMLPAGAPTEEQIRDLKGLLAADDIVIDGGNSNYRESQRRGAFLALSGIHFIDAGTSGGVWGLDNGYCMMVGGAREAVSVIEPVLKALAPAADRGWAHVGPVGAGHYTKMVHNGIEYGMMQAFAEGFALLRSKEEFNLDLAQISELWRHSSVVRSWLLDLTAEGLAHDQELTAIGAVVSDSGEGRWTVVESVEQGIPLPVITLALQMRFASQGQQDYQARLLSLMRNAFGGHAMQKAPGV